MNKSIILILALFLAIPLSNYAQNASKIKPVNISWLADGKELNITQAQKGIKIPNKLEISVVLEFSQKLSGQKLEFKWYRRGTTKDYLTNSFIEKIENIEPGQEKITIVNGRTNLKKGWWKVQIESYADKKSISFDNKQEFWIKLD